MQTAGLSGSADITELANQPNYSHLPASVNTAIVSLSRYQTCGYMTIFPYRLPIARPFVFSATFIFEQCGTGRKPGRKTEGGGRRGKGGIVRDANATHRESLIPLKVAG